MSAFDDIEAIGPLRVWNDVVAREVHGEQSTLAVVELEPGAIVPEHHHPNEQLGLVIQGTVEFRVGERDEGTRPGIDLEHSLGRAARGARGQRGRSRHRRLRPGARRLGRPRARERTLTALALAPTRGTVRCARHDSNVRPLPPQGTPTQTRGRRRAALNPACVHALTAIERADSRTLRATDSGRLGHHWATVFAAASARWETPEWVKSVCDCSRADGQRRAVGGG